MSEVSTENIETISAESESTQQVSIHSENDETWGFSGIRYTKLPASKCIIAVSLSLSIDWHSARTQRLQAVDTFQLHEFFISLLTCRVFEMHG